MIFSKKTPLIVGLDIGTSAIKIAVGEQRTNGVLSLVGSYRVESRGIRKGEVVNASEASACILQAIQEAEEALNMEINDVELALTGGHIESGNHRGTVPIRSDTHQVSEEDVNEAVENARGCVLMSEGKTMLSVIRQQFFIDDNHVALQPYGLTGSRLEADVHCIHGVATRFQNTLNCFHARQETVVDVNSHVFSGLASALAVLGQHEKTLGAVVLDIGAGTTEYVVYAKGMIRQTGVLAVGGDHLVNDLLLGLKLQSRRRAESIIHEHGSVWLEEAIRGKTIKINTSDLIADRERTLHLEHIHSILHCRMDEILRIIYERICSQGLHELISGGVFITGGCSRITGIVDLAEDIFQMSATVAVPHGFDGQVENMEEPEMSTAVGLVKYGHRKRLESDATPSGVKAYLKRFLGMGGGFN
jgi:cell division protein FtsA